MKNKLNRFLGLFLFCFVMFSGDILAQAPPPPSDHGGQTNNGPMGAPVDGGVAVFLAFAATFAGREWIKRRKSGKQEEEQSI
jgi:hypothetical protein